ncbi:DUF4760 domain-containing protein [Rivihabitans pingtungensis]|uniref:DUF4760 domain-containing protein n=1 Tax=Rivihabitans pingtungensis TaxID=1054498 RepID=UPI0023570621|nr:hypothetical protein [Rivihabitans pingtungensis]MCK6438238.1 hypothetical protein [Rivihabitans pingtungensis]
MKTEIYNLLSIIIQTLTFIVLILTVLAATRQFRASRTNTWAQAFQGCLNLLQDPKVIQARAAVFEIGDKGTPLHSLSLEDLENIDLVCRTYDAVGMMAKWGMIPAEIVADSWCDSIRRLWPICEPRVKAHRSRRKANEFWDDFEWLYNQAVVFDNNRGVKSQKTL